MGDNGEVEELEGTTSITLPKDDHREVSEIKPDGVSWPWFLKQAARAWQEKNG